MRITALQQSELEHRWLHKTIIIHKMDGEPQYSGKIGMVTCVDDIGQLHGTWGGCAVNPFIDSFEEIYLK